MATFKELQEMPVVTIEQVARFRKAALETAQELECIKLDLKDKPLENIWNGPME